MIPDPLLLAALPVAWAALLFLATAFYALCRFSPSRTLELAGGGRRRKRLERLFANPDPLIQSFRYLRVVAYVLAAGGAAPAGARLGLPLPASAAVTALAILVAAELPAAVIGPRVSAPFLARTGAALALLHRLALPLVRLEALLDRTLSALGGQSLRDLRREQAEEELRAAAAEGARGGLLDEKGREMIEGILRLKDLPVGDIMTPWVEVVALSAEAPVEEALWVARWKRHSRIPVFEGSRDHIVGILDVKDLLEDWGRRGREVDLRRHLRPAQHVPETKPVAAILQEFRRSRGPIAIVVDEYGSPVGLVTIADVLEVIVGEIRHEGEGGRRPALLRLPDGGADLDARLNLARVNEELGTRFPESEAYDTIGGFLVSRLGHVPEKGERLAHGDFELIVLEADDRRVHRLRIAPLTPSKEPSAAGEAER